MRAHLGLARRFGCGFLRLVIDSAGDEPSAEQAVARLRAILPELWLPRCHGLTGAVRYPLAQRQGTVQLLPPGLSISENSQPEENFQNSFLA